MSQNCGSFYRLFSCSSFFFLTSAEIRAFNGLKALFSALVSKKKNRLKRTSKKNRYFGTCKLTDYCLLTLQQLLKRHHTTEVYQKNCNLSAFASDCDNLREVISLISVAVMFLRGHVHWLGNP